MKKPPSLILAETVVKNLNEAIKIIEGQRAALGRVESNDAYEARVRLEAALEALEESKNFASAAFHSDG